MKTVATLAAIAATAAAVTPGAQFVLYAQGDESSSQRADPIITPGKLSGHVHDFAGSASFKPELSYDMLQNTDCTTVGSADEKVGGFKKDHSTYWHPAMYANSTDGYIKIPTTLHKMYYRVPNNAKYAEPFEFPKGWQMVAGDPFLREPNSKVTGVTHWQCMGPDVEGVDGGFPDLSSPCDDYSGLVGKVHFPHCWDGEDITGRDYTEYSAYPEGDASYGQCPSSHPYAVPHIEFENLFAMGPSIWGKIDVSTLTLAQGDSTGFGMHGDMFNGWESGAIEATLDSCPEAQYGNQDVGLCSGFEPHSTPRNQCKQTNYFPEKVAAPGSALIGCNPVTSAIDKIAKMFAVAPLHTVSTSCTPLDGSAPPSDTSDDSDDTYEAPSYSADSPSSSSSSSAYVQEATTLATTATTATTAAPAGAPTYGAPPGGWGSIDWSSIDYDDAEDDDDDYDIVYEYVTATATATAEVYARDNSHRHRHMHAHNRRRDF